MKDMEDKLKTNCKPKREEGGCY